MSFRDKVGSFLKREAKDLADAAEGMRDKLDDELTKREQELEMTPSEKIKALQQQGSETDAKLEAIAGKVKERSAERDAAADIPNVTHIVMADPEVGAEAGASKSPPTVVDASGEVVEIPVVEAPSAADLNKVATSDAPPANPPLVTRPTSNTTPAAAENPAVTPPQVAKPSNPAVTPVSSATTPQVAKPSNPVVAPVSSATTPQVAKSSNPAVTPPQVAKPSNPAPQVAKPSNPAVTPVSSNPTEAVTPAASSTSGAEPEPAAAEAAETETDYHKAPAQIKYERARAAANDLLDELRGELEADGEI